MKSMDGQREKHHLIKNQKNNRIKENTITKIVMIVMIEMIEMIVIEVTDNKRTINKDL